VFRSGIERIASHGVGDAVFSVVNVSDTVAVLRGKMVSDAGIATDHRLAEYLDNTLVPEEGIRLDFEVQIQTDERPRSEGEPGGRIRNTGSGPGVTCDATNILAAPDVFGR
jgi:hypothetical protein